MTTRAKSKLPLRFPAMWWMFPCANKLVTDAHACCSSPFAVLCLGEIRPWDGYASDRRHVEEGEAQCMLLMIAHLDFDSAGSSKALASDPSYSEKHSSFWI